MLHSQVSVMEDEEQQISYRNLGLHLANNEEEALNLLFLGDTNRVIGATLMNQSSSRSHCIFTVHVEARKASTGKPSGQLTLAYHGPNTVFDLIHHSSSLMHIVRVCNRCSLYDCLCPAIAAAW